MHNIRSCQKSMDNRIIQQHSHYYRQINLVSMCISGEQPPNYLETAKQWGKVTNTMYSWQKSTTCRNGMQVLWCHYYVVWWFLRVPSLLALVFIHKLCYDFSHSSYLCHTIKLVINFYSISFIAQMTLLSLRNFFIPKLVLLLLL